MESEETQRLRKENADLSAQIDTLASRVVELQTSKGIKNIPEHEEERGDTEEVKKLRKEVEEMEEMLMTREEEVG